MANEAIVGLCHDWVDRKNDDPLELKANSYVVETDLKHPIDYVVHRDAMNTAMREVREVFRKLGLDGWRQHRYLRGKLRKLTQLVSRKCKNSPGFVDAANALLNSTGKQLAKVRASLERLPKDSGGSSGESSDEGSRDDMTRRSFRCSSRARAGFQRASKGRPVEPGIPVCVTKDQLRFILGLGHHVERWRPGCDL